MAVGGDSELRSSAQSISFSTEDEYGDICNFERGYLVTDERSRNEVTVYSLRIRLYAAVTGTTAQTYPGIGVRMVLINHVNRDGVDALSGTTILPQGILGPVDETNDEFEVIGDWMTQVQLNSTTGQGGGYTTTDVWGSGLVQIGDQQWYESEKQVIFPEGFLQRYKNGDGDNMTGPTLELYAIQDQNSGAGNQTSVVVNWTVNYVDTQYKQKRVCPNCLMIVTGKQL